MQTIIRQTSRGWEVRTIEGCREHTFGEYATQAQAEQIARRLQGK